MDMAPPAGSRFVHIMTLTYSSIFTFLNVYCSPFPVFLKPPVGGEPGARSLPSLLAALIRDRAPMVQRTLLNLLRLLLLLLLLLGTEHRWCEDPIESAPFIRDRAPMVRGPYCICVVYYYYYYYYYYFPNLIAF